ncbi:hypothetical protein Vretimale_14423, partial [Volvox reticuliferus]
PEPSSIRTSVPKRFLPCVLGRPALGSATPRRLEIIPCPPPSIQSVPNDFCGVFWVDQHLAVLPPDAWQLSFQLSNYPSSIRTSVPNDFCRVFWVDQHLAVLPPDAWQLS